MAPKPGGRRPFASDPVRNSLSNGDVPVVLPDDLRRTDQPHVLPDSPPARGPPDGGIRQHPVHDDDLEDLGPEDYEEQIEKVEEQSLQEHPRIGITLPHLFPFAPTM